MTHGMGITCGEGLTWIVSSWKTDAGGQKTWKVSLVEQLLRGMHVLGQGLLTRGTVKVLNKDVNA